MFRPSELSRLRTAAESIMGSSLVKISNTRASDGEGGWVESTANGQETQCRLTGLKDEPRLLVDQPDNKSRFVMYAPFDFDANQGDDVRIDGMLFHVEGIKQPTSSQAIQTVYQVWR